MQYDGLILGACTVLSIWFSRWACIAGEYHFGKRIWVLFLVLGVVMLVGALLVSSTLMSSIISVLAFCFLWGIGETIEQEKRVAKGWFPENPKRKKGKEYRGDA